MRNATAAGYDPEAAASSPARQARSLGAATMAQLKEDIAAAQCTLDKGTLDEIKQIQLRYPNPAA